MNEKTKTAPAVPPLPPGADIVKAMASAAAQETRKTVSDELARHGIVTRVAELKSWKPYKKGGSAAEVLEDADVVEVLPEIKGAHRYEDTRGIRYAQFIKAQMVAQKNNWKLEAAVEHLAKKGVLDPFVVKALQEQTLADGGALVPPQFSSELIPLLRAATVLRAAGCRIVQMESDQLIYARQNQAATAYYEGETQVVTHSQAKTGQLKLSAKKLVALTSVTDELLNDAGPAADEFIRDDLVKVIALRMDLAGIRGDGASETPMGLRYQVDSGNIFAATQAGAAATFVEVNNDLTKIVRLVEESNLPPDVVKTSAWLMTPRVKNFLMTLLNAQGFYMFRTEMVEKGTLMGYPFFTTTQIPNNLGGGTESEIYFGPFSQYLLGVKDEMIVQMFPGGAYNDASGNVVSGISNGTTPVRATSRHDFKVRYTNGFVILTTVKYGA